MPRTTATHLLRSCHPGPTVAVTTLGVLLAVSVGNDAVTTMLLALAVLTGQLSIGWSNDLFDAARDRAVGRDDKPIATGELPKAVVVVALAVVASVCVVASVLCGAAAGVTHLVLVGAGWAYNLGLKRTVWSWLPYAVAFGFLPAVATLALHPPEAPPVWMVVTGALLGVGAHLLNALPDLEDDVETGVVGLPHRIGPRALVVVAPLLLGAASVVATFGPGGRPPAWAWTALAVAVALAVVGMRGRGRTPFYAAVGIAAIDVVALTVR